MSSCDESSIKKNYIVQTPTDSDILSACTGFYTNNIYNCTGDTLTLHSTTVSANTVNASVYLSGGTNLLGIFGSLDNYTTGATLVGTTAVFDRTDSLSAYTLDLSTLDSNDTFVTGFTYDNLNSLTLTRNDNVLISVNITQFSGITVDGGLSATTISACTGIYTSNLYGCSPITVHDNIQSVGSSATGTTSFAFGNNTKAYGNYSHAEGRDTIASGYISHAEGQNTIASGSRSHAEGRNTTASGTAGHAEGFETTASGVYSHAEGRNTKASGVNSHAEGTNTTASGNYSHAEGDATIASGDYSHAEGSFTISSGYDSHAEGFRTTASGYDSHAEGFRTTASGSRSHSEGFGTEASGFGSHSGGWGLDGQTNTIIASGETSFVHFKQTSNSGIIGAYGDYSVIIGGNDHNIGTGSTSSGIFAGSGNTISDDVLRSVVIGGGNITGTTSDTVYVPNLNINNIDNDDSLTQILSRDSSDGTIKYRDVQSIISAATSQDTFVTGFTYDNINTFTISDNSGSTFNASINVLSATTISATTYFGDGSNLSGISTDNFYVTGGTYNEPTKEINFTGNSVQTTFDVDLTSLISSVSGDTFVVSGNANAGTSELTFSYNTGGTFTVTNSAALFSDNDINVTGGTYNPSNGCVSFVTNSGTTFDVCGFVTGITDTYTTGSTLVGETIQFNNNIDGLNYYNVSLSPVLSGKTNNVTFNTYTSDTQTILDSKVGDGVNVGSGTGEIFSGKSGTTLNFRTLSGGSNTTLTTIGDVVKIDVAVPSGDNFFSTAGTVTQSATTGDTAITLQIVGTSGFSPYSITGLTDTFVNDFTFSSNTFTITQNDGSSFDSSIETIELGNILSAVTFDIGTSGSISATTFNGDTFSGGTFYGDGSNLTGIDNFYVTGGTVTGETTVVLTRNDNVNIPVTGITSTGLFGQHTGDTNNPHVVTISQLSGVSETLFNTYTGDTETVLLTKVEDGNNVGGATEVFRDKTGTTLNFRTLSGGTNTTVTTIGDVNRIDVSIPTDLNTFVTGFTYNDNNTFTINDNVGSAFAATINQVSGLTVNGTLSATTLDGSVILSGGTNLTTIIEGFDTYVTGGTVSISATTDTNSATIGLLYKNSEGVPHTLPFYDTFTTGATYDNGTALVTFDKNDGTNYFLNLSTIDVNDTFVSGGTYNDSTDIITFTNTSGGTFNVTGITDTFVTGGAYSSGTTSLDFSGNTGFAPFSVNVSELIDDTNTFVTGFTYNDTNTFTISNNNGSNYSASIDVMSGLTVNGNSVFSGTGTDVVQIYGSGSTTPILSVEGSAGELFSITDSLTGELFAVNNISAETILSVNSDNTILWGDPTVPSLNTTVKKSINSGLSEIYSIPVSAYTGGFFEYTVTGSGARAGSIMSIFSGTSIDFNETTTNDIGDTSGITFDMNISGGTANLTVSATTNSWEIRTIVRSI